MKLTGAAPFSFNLMWFILTAVQHRLTFLLIFGITYASIGATNPGQICKNESDGIHHFLSSENRTVFCTGLLPEKNRLRLPNQCNEEDLDKKAIYLSTVKGVLHKYSFGLFPHVRMVVIDRSQIEVFLPLLKIGTTLHITESTFPNLTSEMFSENRYIATLGLHSNINHTIHQGAFKRLWLLENLIIYNQSVPELHEDFLTGLTNLRKVVLNRNNLSRIHEDVFKGLNNLRQINLNHNPLKHFTPKLHYLPRIERISLSGTKVMQLSWRIFNPVSCLKTFELPTTALSKIDEIKLLHMAIAFPNLKCFYWNSMEENSTHDVRPLLQAMESSGLVVLDTKKSYIPVSTIFKEEPPYPELDLHCYK